MKTALTLVLAVFFAATALANPVLSIEGDSHCANNGNGYEWWRAVTAAFPGATLNDFALGGDSAASMVGEYASQAGAVKINPGESYFFLLAGSNDLTGADSAAAIYQYLKTLWSSARASGYKVVAMTLFPRQSYDAGQEKKRVELNALIRANSKLYDYLAPLDRALAGGRYTTLYASDGTHLNQAGNAILARTVLDALGLTAPSNPGR
jgi:lysophospholipase L1-like esterase